MDITIVEIALGTLAITTLTYLLHRYNYKLFARNEFKKKQMQTVIELTEHLHNDYFEISFTRIYDKSRHSKNSYSTIFELHELFNNNEFANEFEESPILFAYECNQLVNCRKFMNNPFLPKKIADKLLLFYNHRTRIESISDRDIDKVIILKTMHFEEGIFERKTNNQNMDELRTPSAFAFNTSTNFIQCSVDLEKEIISWLKKYRLEDINIRKDFAHR